MEPADGWQVGALRRMAVSIAKAVRPDRKVLADEWAEKNRVLPEDTPYPGPFRNEPTPYLIDIQRTMSPGSPWREGWWMKPLQVGGSVCGENLIGTWICEAAGSMAVVFPTLDDARIWELSRFEPMRSNTRPLRKLIRPADEKGSDNTKLRKRYKGGVMRLLGANRPIKSSTLRYLKFEEPDEYPLLIAACLWPDDSTVRKMAGFEIECARAAADKRENVRAERSGAFTIPVDVLTSALDVRSADAETAAKLYIQRVMAGARLGQRDLTVGTGKGSFSSLFDTFKADLLRELIEDPVRNSMRNVVDIIGKELGKLGTENSPLTKLGDYLSGLFSGTGGSGGGTDWLGAIGGFFGFTGRANGGGVRAGQLVSWQEGGREWFVPGDDGQVVTERQMGSGGQAVSQNNTYNINGGTENWRRQVAAMLDERDARLVRSLRYGRLRSV